MDIGEIKSSTEQAPSPDELAQLSDFSVQIGKRLLEHLAMTGVPGGCNLLLHPLAGEEQAFFLLLLRDLFKGKAQLGLVLRSCGLGLLLFDGFAFPTAGHKESC